jgi:ferric-dicitrate binding protein FerR (iron transport regulator)
MILDHNESRAWADHGHSWSNFAGKAIDRLRDASGRRSAAHLPRLARAVAAIAAALAFVGIAVLPGLNGSPFS